MNWRTLFWKMKVPCRCQILAYIFLYYIWVKICGLASTDVLIGDTFERNLDFEKIGSIPMKSVIVNLVHKCDM